MALNTAPSSHLILTNMGRLPTFIGAVEDQWQLYSDCASDYVLGRPIGFGASSIVYAATYQPPDQKSLPCALKVLDLDTLPLRSWSLLRRETTLMSLSKHPNVLRVRGSWMVGHKLYIALRLMNKGSAADVMRYGWPGGMEEDVIKCILEQALQGLNYLHINGFIHRDVKAANLLIDDDGTVLLGDLGVAADLSEGPSDILSSVSSSEVAEQSSFLQHSKPTPKRPKINKRKSFVGTPCWMAPEIIQGKQYDSSADIWSFGITALELTQGRPPRSREPAQKVLLRTIQEDPPTLDRDGGTYRYSKAFQEMIESCLAKDPSKRPTADQLLRTSFFRNVKKKSYLISAILKDLPPLANRQEKRVRPNSQIHHSVDSWDFTLHSVPVSPVSPTKWKGSLETTIEPNTAFELEDDFDPKQVDSHSYSLGTETETSTSKDPSANEFEQPSLSRHQVVRALKDTNVTALPDPITASDKTLPIVIPPASGSATLLSKTTPIPIFKPATSSSLLRPVTPQDDLLSASPASAMSSSISSHASSLFTKDKVSSSSSSSLSSPSQGRLWSKIKSKTSTKVNRITSLGGATKLQQATN